MLTSMKVKHYPLSNGARSVILLAFIINIIALLIVASYYPNNYKSAPLIVPGIFLSAFVLFLLILRFRYTLLERYPYMLNLPSFVYRLGMEKNSTVEGAIINKVFTVFSISTLYVSILNLVVTAAILWQNSLLLLLTIPTVVIVFIVTVFALYRSIYRSFAVKG